MKFARFISFALPVAFLRGKPLPDPIPRNSSFL